MPTMREIAREARVSYTTVSYVLSQRDSPRGISAQTRRRVLEVAERLGYQRDALARAMVTGERPLLAFLTGAPGPSTEYLARVLYGAIEAASGRGYLLKTLQITSRADLEHALSQCGAWRISGAVALNLETPLMSELLERLLAQKIAVATVEDFESEYGERAIRSDEEGGLKATVAHLASNGHRRFAYLAARAGEPVSERRITTLREQLAAHGLPGPEVAFGDWWDALLCEQAARQLLTAVPPPTALLCCGDGPALVALRVARTLGIPVPGQLSVVGHGDYVMADYADPPLTTIAQPFQEMGRRAVEALLEDDTPWRLPVPTRLCLRETTSSAPK